ncbi:hypothetical protein GCM10025868_31980 [Angustibacter aerolatus]|uniref:UspA domain-containing protein n=1 Tax=Angustibacter aerolatus TaxID=1162965 RepID=A0ABQ6JKL4_9ACTN|nr:universal stress protein [Angustibacter aerolatus]GMA87948.1 hypothetical protein GCM10025868_31980 [Angustibacter aerolatus]
MSVVVGYVPTTAGFQAVTEALREAQWRGTDLVVVNVVGTAGYTTPTAADDQDLDALEVRLAESGVPHTIHRLDVSAEDASDEILRLADETDAEPDRRRDPPPVGRRQGDPRQQRPAGAARRALPGARRPPDGVATARTLPVAGNEGTLDVSGDRPGLPSTCNRILDGIPLHPFVRRPSWTSRSGSGRCSAPSWSAA